MHCDRHVIKFNLVFDSWFFFSSPPKGSLFIKSTCFSKNHIKEKTACHVAFQWQHAISVIIPVQTAGDLIISLKTWPQIPLEKIEWNTSSLTQKSRFPHSIVSSRISSLPWNGKRVLRRDAQVREYSKWKLSIGSTGNSWYTHCYLCLMTLVEFLFNIFTHLKDQHVGHSGRKGLHKTYKHFCRWTKNKINCISKNRP